MRSLQNQWGQHNEIQGNCVCDGKHCWYPLCQLSAVGFPTRLRFYEIDRCIDHRRFGGLGSTTGAVVSAVVLGILNMYLQGFSDLRMIIYALALIIIMIFKPSGL